jgi:hypothetical protein
MNYPGILKFLDYLKMQFDICLPKIMPPDSGDGIIHSNKRHDNTTGNSSLPEL